MLIVLHLYLKYGVCGVVTRHDCPTCGLLTRSTLLVIEAFAEPQVMRLMVFLREFDNHTTENMVTTHQTVSRHVHHLGMAPQDG